MIRVMIGANTVNSIDNQFKMKLGLLESQHLTPSDLGSKRDHKMPADSMDVLYNPYRLDRRYALPNQSMPLTCMHITNNKDLTDVQI